MSDPEMIRGIIASVTTPVMAKVRIGHFVEAQILEALAVDYVDRSEVLTRPMRRPSRLRSTKASWNRRQFGTSARPAASR